MRNSLLALTIASLLIGTSSFAQDYNSFNEVQDVVFNESLAPDLTQPIVAQEWEVYQRNELPHYQVTWRNFWRRYGLRFFNFLKFNAKRTVREHNNFYPRLEKLVHSNGICFSGLWQITEESPYTGMLATGSQGLFIGRASSANSATQRGQKRPFGFAGKVFPTLDPDVAVPTLNFVTIDNLSGTRAKHFMDVSLTNEPKAGFAFTPAVSINIFAAFRAADINIFFRPIDPLYEYPLRPDEVANGPRWIMIKAAGEERVDAIDFREELQLDRYQHPVELSIYVSNNNRNPNLMKYWQKLGQIILKKSIVSYGCDRQLHFHHNKMKITAPGR